MPISSTLRPLYLACLLTATTFAAQGAWAQTYSQPPQDKEKKSTHQHGTAATDASGKSSAVLKADLVEPEKKAKEKAATVKVEVTGLELVDPATVNEKAKAGQGHLHYQVDDDPIVATTTKKLSFHALSSGKHTIKVVLAGNDHSPLGPEQTLDVNIP
jgi:hypothetical protein